VGIEHFQNLVTSVEQLTTVIGTPSDLVIRKQLSELDDHMKSFLATSPFALLGTVGRDGRCDVSPRGDMPFVAKVLDSRTLIIAERFGNRRVDSLRNIVETGRAGLLFLTPGLGETLRINGRACVFQDVEILKSMTMQGKQPVAGIGVEVEECYFQCAKAVIRSKLWESTGQDASLKPLDFAEILIDQTKIEGQSVEALREQIAASYRDRLY
jgi:PPOX class probable FMN-dependent enzyme